MKKTVRALSILLLAAIAAGCSTSAGGGSAQPDYYRSLGSCNNNPLGPGYSRDYSYGDRYAAGQTRRC
jgi:hypothetical protein